MDGRSEKQMMMKKKTASQDSVSQQHGRTNKTTKVDDFSNISYEYMCENIAMKLELSSTGEDGDMELHHSCKRNKG